MLSEHLNGHGAPVNSRLHYVIAGIMKCKFPWFFMMAEHVNVHGAPLTSRRMVPIVAIKIKAMHHLVDLINRFWVPN